MTQPAGGGRVMRLTFSGGWEIRFGTSLRLVEHPSLHGVKGSFTTERDAVLNWTRSDAETNDFLAAGCP